MPYSTELAPSRSRLNSREPNLGTATLRCSRAIPSPCCVLDVPGGDAVTAGLDEAALDQCLDTAAAPLLDQDLADAQRLGIDATPSFIIDGRLVDNPALEGLSAAVDAALAARKG